ncbi:hypothetical protein I7I51_03195 [Histoplasma capsulatum]|uniref:Uncharacterized protein n=1 Tax=Ajellomyces capsulatus TaxID=5037 RepID=A0A8A1MQW0_AJECA|nr:hypothetical protein I7I51_03195 [Histoplasma capsulatum]
MARTQTGFDRTRAPSRLKTKLSELGDIVCNLGEEDIGEFLKTLCDSPNDTTSFFKAVTAAIRRQNTRGPTRHEFFQNFESGDQALSAEQISSLATITENWELDDNELEELKKSAARWTSEPKTFFDSKATKCPGWHGLVEFCFNDSQQIKHVSPVRRVVNSIKVFESIEEEVRARSLEYKKNHKESLEPQEPRKILTRVLDSTAEKIWRQLPKEEIRKQRSRLYDQYCKGKKWAQIKPSCMVLSLQSTSVKSFERRKWVSIEISAVNAYIEHLRAFSMRDSLSMTYRKIHEEYVCRSSPQNQPTNSPHAIDGQNGKQKRAISSLRLPPGKRRRTQASMAHIGPSSNSPSNIEKNIHGHRPYDRFWIRPIFEPSTSSITGLPAPSPYATRIPSTPNSYGTCETNQQDRGESGGPETVSKLSGIPAMESEQSAAPHFASEERTSSVQNSQNPVVDAQLYDMQQVDTPAVDETQYAWGANTEQLGTPAVDATQYAWGANTEQLGTPAVDATQYAWGANTEQLGTPAVDATQYAWGATVGQQPSTQPSTARQFEDHSLNVDMSQRPAFNRPQNISMNDK